MMPGCGHCIWDEAKSDAYSTPTNAISASHATAHKPRSDGPAIWLCRQRERASHIPMGRHDDSWRALARRGWTRRSDITCFKGDVKRPAVPTDGGGEAGSRLVRAKGRQRQQTEPYNRVGGALRPPSSHTTGRTCVSGGFLCRFNAVGLSPPRQGSFSAQRRGRL